MEFRKSKCHSSVGPTSGAGRRSDTRMARAPLNRARKRTSLGALGIAQILHFRKSKCHSSDTLVGHFVASRAPSPVPVRCGWASRCSTHPTPGGRPSPWSADRSVGPTSGAGRRSDTLVGHFVASRAPSPVPVRCGWASRCSTHPTPGGRPSPWSADRSVGPTSGAGRRSDTLVGHFVASRAPSPVPVRCGWASRCSTHPTPGGRPSPWSADRSVGPTSGAGRRSDTLVGHFVASRAPSPGSVRCCLALRCSTHPNPLGTPSLGWADRRVGPRAPVIASNPQGESPCRGALALCRGKDTHRVIDMARQFG